MISVQELLGNLVSDVEGAKPDNSGDVDVDSILRVDDVKGKDLKWFIDQMANGNALLFYGRAYKLFKRILADSNGYRAEMIREDERAWLEARWVSQDNPNVHVDYRVPFYKNDSGHKVSGKRVTLDGWN